METVEDDGYAEQYLPDSLVVGSTHVQGDPLEACGILGDGLQGRREGVLALSFHGLQDIHEDGHVLKVLLDDELIHPKVFHIAQWISLTRSQPTSRYSATARIVPKRR